MKKLFTFILAALVSVGVWADYTWDFTEMSEADKSGYDALTTAWTWNTSNKRYDNAFTSNNGIWTDVISSTITQIKDMKFMRSGSNMGAGAIRIFQNTSGKKDGKLAYNNSNVAFSIPATEGDTITINFSNTNSSAKGYVLTNAKRISDNATTITAAQNANQVDVLIATETGRVEFKCNDSKVLMYKLVLKNPVTTNYTITYDANGGEGEMENSTNTIAENGFTYEGKDFVEWNTQADGEGTAYAPGAKASSDLNLYAIWQDHVAKYTVVYKDGTTELGSEQVTVGETPAGITAPTKDCYIFEAWSPALNTVSGEEDAEVVVNATWTPIYSSSATLISAENVTAKTNVNTIFAAANIVSSITFVEGNYEFTSNEAKKGYYGYKDKQSGDNFKILLEQGKQVQVLFGNLGADPTIKINGANGALDAARASGDNAENTFTYHASEEDALISITLGSGTNTLKQITIADYVLSDDATIKSLIVNGEAVEAVEDVYSYVVGSTSEATKVAVVFVLNDAKATADQESGFEIDVPEAGAAANTATITVTAEDETQKVYTVSVTKATAASTDATLKALSVEGFTLAPAFDPAVVEYTITKAYEAALPATSKVTATANDANATVNVAYNELVENEILVQVIAEDEETAKTYSIRVLSADAKKDLLEAKFSNGAKGYISNGNIRVPYLNGTEEPTFVSAKFWNADGEPTAALIEDELVVTGIDGKKANYSIEYVAITPMEAQYDSITFTAVPSYIFSVYGWASDKGVKFSKDAEEASNHRISEGKDRIYIALPAAKEVRLISGSGAERPVEILVNGVSSAVNKTAKSNEAIAVTLNQNETNFIGIEANGSNGDGGFIKMLLVQSDGGSAISNTSDAEKAQKRIENGQLVIEKNGKVFNAMGQTIR